MHVCVIFFKKWFIAGFFNLGVIILRPIYLHLRFRVGVVCGFRLYNLHTLAS